MLHHVASCCHVPSTLLRSAEHLGVSVKPPEGLSKLRGQLCHRESPVGTWVGTGPSGTGTLRIPRSRSSLLLAHLKQRQVVGVVGKGCTQWQLC